MGSDGSRAQLGGDRDTASENKGFVGRGLGQGEAPKAALSPGESPVVWSVAETWWLHGGAVLTRLLVVPGQWDIKRAEKVERRNTKANELKK